MAWPGSQIHRRSPYPSNTKDPLKLKLKLLGVLEKKVLINVSGSLFFCGRWHCGCRRECVVNASYITPHSDLLFLQYLAIRDVLWRRAENLSHKIRETQAVVPGSTLIPSVRRAAVQHYYPNNPLVFPLMPYHSRSRPHDCPCLIFLSRSTLFSEW